MEEDPVVSCCCSFLFRPLTSQATCSTDEKAGQGTLGGRGEGEETRDSANELKFYLLLRGKQNSFPFRNTHVDKLLHGTSYNMYLQVWVNKKEIHISVQSQLGFFA